jgi:hypothetical protein
MISVTIAMVTTVQRQYSYGVSRFLENCFFDDFDFRINENYDFKSIDLLIGLGILMICTHDLYVLTKRKETIRYCKSFGYGGQCAFDKRFYRSNGVSVLAEKWIKYPHRGLFTNILI